METKETMIRGVVAVIPRDGTFLLIRRAQHLPAGGGWCLPGGTIEPGETPDAAIVRECHEEVGLAVKAAQELWITQTAQLHLRWWLVECGTNSEVTPCSAEVSDFRWLRIDQLALVTPLLPGVETFFKKFGSALAG